MGAYWVIILLILRVSGDVFMGIHDGQHRLDMMQPLVDEWVIDSKIRIEYSPEKGIYVVANKDLSGYEKVARVPERYIMSVNDNFPFKETYVNALARIHQAKDILSNPLDPIVGAIIQICQILVNLNTNRQKIEQAIDGYNDFELYIENWSLWRNYLYSLPDKEVSDTPVIWSKQDNVYWAKIVDNYSDQSYLSDIYDELLVVLTKMKTPKATFLREKVLVSKEQFLWACMIINIKSFSSSYEDYLVLSQNRPKKNIKNHRINMKHFKNVGVFMMPVADLSNQIHPTKEDLSDSINFSFSYERGYIDFSTSGSFKSGEEYGFLYSQHLPSTFLVVTHGYAIEDNLLEDLVVSLGNLFIYLRPELRTIWKAQKWIPEGINYSTNNRYDGQGANNDEIHFNFRRRDKYDEHFLDFMRIITYSNMFDLKFDKFFDAENAYEKKDIIDSMFNDSIQLYLSTTKDYGYLAFYNEILAMDNMVAIIDKFLSLAQNEFPDPDSLPNRKAVCVTAAISQRNVFYHHIRNLRKRTLAMIKTQILNEF